MSMWTWFKDRCRDHYHVSYGKHWFSFGGHIDRTRVSISLLYWTHAWLWVGNSKQGLTSIESDPGIQIKNPHKYSLTEAFAESKARLDEKMQEVGSDLDRPEVLVLDKDIGDPADFAQGIPTFWPFYGRVPKAVFDTDLAVYYTLATDIQKATHVRFDGQMLPIVSRTHEVVTFEDGMTRPVSVITSDRWYTRRLKDRCGVTIPKKPDDVPLEPPLGYEPPESVIACDKTQTFYPVGKKIPLGYSLRSTERVYAKCAPADATHVLFEVGLGGMLRKIIKRENFKLYFDDRSTIDIADVPESSWMCLKPEEKPANA